MADNRNKILFAARSLVSEGGWREAQVSSVAAVAGLATGTVYRYFPSKAELFVEVLSAVSQREVDVLEAIAQGQESPADRLRTAVSTFVERAMRNRRLAYALIAEPCDREIDEARLAYRHEISKQIMRIVRDGQAAGDEFDQVLLRDGQDVRDLDRIAPVLEPPQDTPGDGGVHRGAACQQLREGRVEPGRIRRLEQISERAAFQCAEQTGVVVMLGEHEEVQSGQLPT